MGGLVSPVAPVPLADLGRVHFTGIGGAGMSGIARIMIARGVKVSGSDAAASDLLTALAAAGADVHVGHAAENIDGLGAVGDTAKKNPIEFRGSTEEILNYYYATETVYLLTAGAHRVRPLFRTHSDFSGCGYMASLAWQGRWLLYSGTPPRAMVVDSTGQAAAVELAGVIARIPGVQRDGLFNIAWSPAP